MKLAIITDIHHAPASSGGIDIRPVVESFVAAAISERADVLVDLGDRHDDFDRETDLHLARELAEIFARFPRPRLHLRGNHDVVNLTDDDHEVLLGRRPGGAVLDLGVCRLVVWEPSVTFNRQVGFPPAAGDLPWLLDTLNADERPAIIATHIPLSGASMAGNYYFENNAGFATYPDHAEIRDAVEATGRAAMWLSGHVHWNSLATVGNLRHVTIQSTSETYTTAPDAACSWAILEVDHGSATLTVHGKDPLYVRIPFARSGDRPWPTPRPHVS